MTNNLKSATLDIAKFGLNLWKIRTDKGMTREALADEIGLADQRIIYDYENGIEDENGFVTNKRGNREYV